MQPKQILKLYLTPMTKLVFKIGVYFLIPGCLISCGQTEDQVTVNATIFYINETNETVSIVGDCGFEEGYNNALLLVEPEETLIVHIVNSDEMIPPKPTIDNFYPFVGSCYAIYGDSVKCDVGFEVGIGDILNYEDRKETSKYTFEFTYRFTEATKEAAEDCQ